MARIYLTEHPQFYSFKKRTVLENLLFDQTVFESNNYIDAY